MDLFKSRPWFAALAAAAVTALGVGGVAIAQSSGSSPAAPPKAQSAPEKEKGGPDKEKGGTEKENTAADPDNVQDENGKDDATEKSKEGGKAEKAGSEVPNDDGADGGHADESTK